MARRRRKGERGEEGREKYRKEEQFIAGREDIMIN